MIRTAGLSMRLQPCTDRSVPERGKQVWFTALLSGPLTELASGHVLTRTRPCQEA